ncbi:MAG: DUF547 domain-containing protein [Candidatus Thiodiazotropha sp. (ex Monitilora ramsayi)]|nr:DUF547 domain-containing protein [Candidatus Thiodiazotropha sp. (ex Monitilora ramsayi)]
MLKNILLLLVMISMVPGLNAAPRAEAWLHWNKSQPNKTVEISHAPWQAFLDQYLVLSEDGINRLNYADVSQNDRQSLTSYLDQLQQLPVDTMTRNQQLAFWINLYNAGTVSVILDHYPVKSILDIDISPGLFSNGPWGKKLFSIDGQRLSLDDIEHRILRPLWRNPLIHYGLNCASLGCPNLQTVVFTADNADGLLEQAAKAFINHRRGASVSGDRLVVSSIYDWFKDDFGKDDAAVIQHLRQYANDSLHKQLMNITKIDDDAYDWSLNQAPNR